MGDDTGEGMSGDVTGEHMSGGRHWRMYKWGTSLENI